MEIKIKSAALVHDCGSIVCLRSGAGFHLHLLHFFLSLSLFSCQWPVASELAAVACSGHRCA